jgi:hypothetical protein
MAKTRRMCITVDGDLLAKMQAMSGRQNWSRVASMAFAEVVNSPAPQKKEPTVNDDSKQKLVEWASRALKWLEGTVELLADAECAGAEELIESGWPLVLEAIPDPQVGQVWVKQWNCGGQMVYAGRKITALSHGPGEPSLTWVDALGPIQAQATVATLKKWREWARDAELQK